MDELKSENKQETKNEFKPDASDRRPQRSRTQNQRPKLAVSRQQMMIGVGILVLLLLIIAISSALKSPTEHEKQQSQNSVEKSIDLSGSPSSSTNTQATNAQNSMQENPSEPATSTPSTNNPREIGMPPISNTPSQDPAPATTGTGSHNQRIELPGDISDALNQQQSNINSAVQKNTAHKNLSSSQNNPVTPSVEQKKTEKVAPPKIEKTDKQHKETAKPAIIDHQANKQSVANATGDLLKVPANRFTLQLSSASRSDTLIAFAKKNNLSNYKVYETKRNDKTWFILIYGSYNSAFEAKKAISSLPTDIQTQKPWVRKLQQVHQDLKK
ncbi:SPOR domain-containing protein [Xenorhabdus sp. Flor]|uniref:SPOR domain-containing protein n=1 Tax=Xenorhabdus cabanillasii TaxID=351673 RepID=UPI001998C3F7|nr:SPOR domain-containing protein [Xenorhabdus sp. Flor]MBD2814811.1 SPOR domain-containing protein [Xenorhabdus sp. Flor]